MRLILLKLFAIGSFLLFSNGVSAAIDAYEFEHEVDRKRYQSFIDEMRCPKCQNQSLSGSDSPIATDLRRELYLMINEGKSDKEIIDFMVERYGEYILYRPRVSSSTLVLWLAPVALLVAGIIVLLVIVRKRRVLNAKSDGTLSIEEQARLADLLEKTNQVDITTSAAQKNAKNNSQENT